MSAKTEVRKPAAAEERRNRRTRRPRREEMPATEDVKAETAPTPAETAEASAETTVPAAAPAPVETVKTETAVVKEAAAETTPAVEPAETQPVRPRRQRQPRRASETPVAPAAEMNLDDINEALNEARYADRKGPSPVVPVSVMNEIDAEVAAQPVDIESDAPENDAEPMIESDSRRRRPRRRRRPTHTTEAVQVMNDAPVTDAPATEDAEAEAVKTPVPEPLKTEAAPAAEVEAPAAETPTEISAEKAPAAAPVVHDIADGLEDNLKKAGLEQVHTDSALAEPYSYVAVKYPGRPRVKVEVADEGPLEQVHTDPKYLTEA